MKKDPEARFKDPKWQETGSILRAGLSWQLALRAERKSPRTIEGYVDNLDLFDRWLRAKGYSNAVESITADEVREWMTGLTDRKGNPARPSTVQTRYKGLRVFFAWAIGEGLVDSSPMANIKPPTLDQPEIPLLSDEQLSAILKVCEGKGFDERRDSAIVRLFLDTGMRLSELTNLTLDNVDLFGANAAAHVIGKGSKARACPIGSRTAKALDAYLRVRDAHPFAHSPRLWLGARGPLTDAGVRILLRRRGQQAGVPGLHAHQFRHTAAHDWLANDGQEGELMRLMGWKARQMVDRYGSSAASERAAEAHKRMGRGDRV